MKKTLLITLEYPPMIGGVANYYQNIISHLPEESIAVLDNSEGALLSNNPRIWPKWIVGVITLYKKVRAENIEHILVGQILPLGTVALLVHFFTGVDYTVMTHAMDLTVPFGKQGSKVKQRLMRLIIDRAHSVTTVSTYTKMQLESLLHVSPRKIIMIYPCPHHDGLQYSQEQLHAFSQSIDDKYHTADKKIVLTVGRLVERKGVDMVLAAFAKTSFSNDTEYIVVGDGPYKSVLEQLSHALGVQDSVRFLGSVSSEEVSSWLARCDVFVMPSRELKNRDVEGFGIVYVEAGSFEKPVIGGKSGGVLDAVVDGENGFLVNAEDVDMIGKAIERLLTDTELAHELGKKGKKRVQDFFQWDIQARRLEKLLTDKTVD